RCCLVFFLVRPARLHRQKRHATQGAKDRHTHHHSVLSIQRDETTVRRLQGRVVGQQRGGRHRRLLFGQVAQQMRPASVAGGERGRGRRGRDGGAFRGAKQAKAESQRLTQRKQRDEPPGAGGRPDGGATGLEQ